MSPTQSGVPNDVPIGFLAKKTNRFQTVVWDANSYYYLLSHYFAVACLGIIFSCIRSDLQDTSFLEGMRRIFHTSIKFQTTLKVILSNILVTLCKALVSKMEHLTSVLRIELQFGVKSFAQME